MKYLFTFLLLSIATLVPAQSQGPGYCLGFNVGGTTGQYVSVPHSTSLNSGSALTIEAWILPTAFGANLYDNVIVGKDGWGSGEQGYALRCGGNGELSFNFATSTGWKQAVATNVLQTSNWQHVAGTFDGDTIRVYVNGVLKGSTAYSGTIVSSTYSLDIGRIPYTISGSREFSGELDEVRVWRSALSPATLRAWMCKKVNGSHPDSANLAGYWRFDDASGTTLTDMSGNSNHGTLQPGMMWGWSGAAIGDESVYDYDLLPPMTLNGLTGGALSVDNYASSVSGIHIYRVDATPNFHPLPFNYTELDTSHYWGVYGVETTGGFNVRYHYGNDPWAAAYPECDLALAARLLPSAGFWNPMNNAVRDLNVDTIGLSMSGRQEFILGVNALPHPAFPAGPTTFCAGDSVLIQTTNSPSLTYQWFNNGVAIPGATGPDYLAVNSGEHHVAVTEGPCTYLSDSVTVQATAPQLNFPGPGDQCVDAPAIILSSGMPAGGSYTGPGVANGVFAPAGAGPGIHTLSYAYTDSNGCSATDSTTLQVFALPATPMVTLSGDTLYSSAAAGNQWHNTNGSIPSATNPFYVPPASGTYYVIVTDSNGCISDSSMHESVTVGLSETRAEAPKILPNPNSGTFRFSIPSGLQDKATVSVYDLQGRQILDFTLAENQTSLYVQLENTAPGMYFIEVKSAGQNMLRKFLVVPEN